MLAEAGRRADSALTRATDVVHEAAHATVLHLRASLVGSCTSTLDTGLSRPLL